jgi:SSS family solute:Na+ symporter
VVNHLPSGLAGVVIAAIFAAAMSSIDSCMNSASTVCVQDFFKRFSTVEREDRRYLLLARALTVLWGVLAVAMSLLFIKSSYALVAWGKLMGISTNGMLGLMALAFMPFRVRAWAAAAGFVTAYAYLFAMMSLESTSCYGR